MKKKLFYILVIIISFLVLFFILKEEHPDERVLKKEINYSDYYSNFVVTNKQAILYKKMENHYVESGSISSGNELSLISMDNGYFQIDLLNQQYYVYYQDVNKIDNLSDKDERYKNYIIFNKDIVSYDQVSFYDESDNLIYTISDKLELPIYIMLEDKYGVVLNDRLLYVKKDDVDEVVDSHHTDEVNTNGIAILNYHFIYGDNDDCDQVICVSREQFSEHLSYIKNNGFFTPTMNELEMYIDGSIQLPKSVVITADDGWLAGNYKELLEQYQLNGTLFLITAWYDTKYFVSDYLEVHSHGDNLHNVGLCSGGQGGAIKCMNHDELLNDLKLSREKIGGTTVFAYPFYEYNNYSIPVLKDAGFTMAFGGEKENGHDYVKPGIDKFRLPRWVIVNYTDMETFIQYLNLK